MIVNSLIEALKQIRDALHVIGFVLVVMVLSGMLNAFLNWKGRK